LEESGGKLMWIKMVFLSYMSLTVVGQEDDGTYNYLIDTYGKYKQKHISLSTKQVIPFKIGEPFIAYFIGECSDAWTVDVSWTTNKEFICNADYIETKEEVYKNDSN